MKHKHLQKIIIQILFFVGVFFPSLALADPIIEISPSISTDGTVYFDPSYCDYNDSNRGVPAIKYRVTEVGGRGVIAELGGQSALVCSFIFGETYAHYLENIIFNGAGVTYNGFTYLVEIHFPDSSSYPDWTRTILYFEAQKYDDLWYSTDTYLPDIAWVEPYNNEVITGTTTVDFNVLYNNQSDKATHLIVKKYLEPYGSLFGQEVYSVAGSFQGNYVWNDELTASTSYRYDAYLHNENTGINYATENINFSVFENEWNDLIGFDPATYEDISGLATTTCGITNLSGCFQNALVFTFYPSEASLLRLSSLREAISKKPPMGYMAMLTDALGGLDGESVGAFTMESEDTITYNIFEPLRSGLSWLLWFVGAIWLYKRVTKIVL